MTKENLSSEKKYLVAKRIADNLLEKGLLTKEEHDAIDTGLKAEIKPLFGKLLSEKTCYSGRVK